jgi:hypothetical protein
MDTKVPSLYDWLSGMEALERLTIRFYEKVLEDELLKELFKGMAAEHPKHVAMFLRKCSVVPRLTAHLVVATQECCPGILAVRLRRNNGSAGLLFCSKPQTKSSSRMIPSFGQPLWRIWSGDPVWQSSIRNPIPQLRLTAQYLCRNGDGVCQEARIFPEVNRASERLPLSQPCCIL